MASLPSIHRFYNEDYPGAPPYFQRLVSTMNLFSDPTYQMLNGGIVPGVNTDEQFHEFTIVGGDTPDANTASFKLTLKHKPRGCYVVSCYPTGAITHPMASAVFVSAYPDGTQMRITGITGLLPKVQYTITVRVV